MRTRQHAIDLQGIRSYLSGVQLACRLYISTDDMCYSERIQFENDILDRQKHARNVHVEIAKMLGHYDD